MLLSALLTRYRGGRGWPAASPTHPDISRRVAACALDTVSNLGGLVGGITADRGNEMKWRVMVELTGSDGIVRSQEVSAGGTNTAECSAATVGLTLTDGKRTLAGLQDHLVQAQAEEYCGQRRLCSHCGSQRPLKDVRARRLLSTFGTVEVRAPRFLPCRCAVTRRHIFNPVAEIMPDRCTPEYERVIAKMGSLLPFRRARTLLSEFLPLADAPAVETIRRRTMRVGARLEKLAVAGPPPAPAAEARAIALSIDGGHVRSVRSYQVRSFEVMLAQVSNDDGKQVVFASMPAEADRQREQLRGVLHGLGATPVAPVTILSDGADGPRSLGEAACIGPTHHVLDWFHLAMRIQHVAQAATSWPDTSVGDREAGARLTETIERIRWRLWHGQVERSLNLMGETKATLEATAETASPAASVALKVAGLLSDLETYVCGQADIIIDYATARRREEPISTAITESTVQWLLHRRMNAHQQMRWSPPGAHLMLKVRCAVMNGMLDNDHAIAEASVHRPYRRAA
jgi:hypothetical protein